MKQLLTFFIVLASYCNLGADVDLQPSIQRREYEDIEASLCGPHIPSLVFPMVTTSAIIEVYALDGTLHGIVLVDREMVPDGRSLPGGIMNFGETIEDAVVRVVSENLPIEIFDLKQFHTYSGAVDSSRWRPLVEVVFTAKTHDVNAICKLAPHAIIVPLDLIQRTALDVRYVSILKDYLEQKHEVHILPVPYPLPENPSE